MIVGRTVIISNMYLQTSALPYNKNFTIIVTAIVKLITDLGLPHTEIPFLSRYFASVCRWLNICISIGATHTKILKYW